MFLNEQQKLTTEQLTEIFAECTAIRSMHFIKPSTECDHFVFYSGTIFQGSVTRYWYFHERKPEHRSIWTYSYYVCALTESGEYRFLTDSILEALSMIFTRIKIDDE